MKKTMYIIPACDCDAHTKMDEFKVLVWAWFPEHARQLFYKDHPTSLILDVSAA